MTTITPDLLRPDDPVATDNYLTHTHGIRSWLLTLDHKRIGIMYLVATLTAFFVGGVFALIIRTQLLVPNGAIFTTVNAYDHYNQMFTLHGAIMVFLVLIPAIPASLGNFALPVMLGAKDVAALSAYLDSTQPIAALTSSQTRGRTPAGGEVDGGDPQVVANRAAKYHADQHAVGIAVTTAQAVDFVIANPAA